MAGGDRDGGSLGLGELILDGHGGALRADLQRYYGLDFVDLWRGTLSPRRVWQLAEHLPHDSSLFAALSGGPQFREWNTQTQLLAQIFNALRVADANNVRVSGGKSGKPKLVEVPTPKKPKRRINLAANPLARKLGE